MEMLLSLPAGATADYNTIADAGIDVKDLGEETVNNVIVVMAALLKTLRPATWPALRSCAASFRKKF